MVESIRVAVVDHHPIFRDGITLLLSSNESCELIAHGADYWEATQIVTGDRPDILILDIDAPGFSCDNILKIGELAPQLKIIILTASECEQTLVNSFKAGAKGFVVKGVTGSQLLEIIFAVQRGGTYAEPRLASAFFAHQRPDAEAAQNPADLLTARENEILERVAEAMTNKEIANCYNITEKTVKHYMTNILQKLNVRNRVEAALVAEKIPEKAEPARGASPGAQGW